VELVTLDLANKPGAVERRSRARLAVSSLIFVKLGEGNGGIAFNISEGGLALSAANGLPDGLIQEFSIQLPDSSDWIPSAAHITWRSDSNKECGVRFVDMGNDSQRLIREWIAVEMSSLGPTSESEHNSALPNAELESAVPPPADTVVSQGKKDKDWSDAAPAPEARGHIAIQDTQPESESAVADATVFQKEKDEDKAVADRRETADHVMLDPVSRPGAVERRTCARLAVSRLPVCSLIFVKLGGGNGGIALNLSEGGLALAAANSLSGDRIPELLIQLPDSRDYIRTAGEIIWRSNSNKKCGVRFFGIHEDARRQIREWIAARTPSSDPGPEPERNSGFQNALPETQPESESADAAVFKKEEEEDKVALDRRRNRPGPGVPVNPYYAETVFDRRVHPRNRIVPLGYVQLGDKNGGITLNVSQGGFSITAANPLPEDHLPCIRLQFPGNSGWVDAQGEIVWRSESKREAGVRFVDLPEPARLQLRNWLSSSAPPLAVEGETEPTPRREKTELLMRTLSAPELSNLGRIPHSHPSDKGPEKATESSRPQGVEAFSDASSLPVAHAEVGSRSRRQAVKWNSGVVRVTIKGGARAWTATVTLLVMVVLVLLIREGLSSRPQGTKRMVNVVTPKQPPATEIAETAPQASPANVATASQPQRPEARQEHNRKSAVPKNSATGGIPSVTLRDLPHGVQDAKLPLAALAAQEPVARLQESQRLNKGQPESSAASVLATNTTLPGEQSRVASAPPAPWPHEEARLAPVLIPAVSPPRNVEATGSENDITKNGGEGSSPPKRTEPAIRVNGTVAITTDPYPSIRFSGQSNRKKSRAGTSMRLGQLLSRVEPVYPEEAMQKGVQGTVRIHVIVSPEGSIQRLVSVDGPPLLVPATVRAVEQWRYSQTMLAGQPVETEDNIAVTFGLSTGINR
jgi:Gram-negative bacterial TonB protein C-terminal/PilZ domain